MEVGENLGALGVQGGAEVSDLASSAGREGGLEEGKMGHKVKVLELDLEQLLRDWES